MMLALGWLGSLLGISIIGVSVLIIGLVLLQKNRGSGLSGAFGGVGGHSAFGTKTGDFLTWVTVGLATVFLLLNVAGVHAFRPDNKQQEPEPTLSTPAELPPVESQGASGKQPPLTPTPMSQPPSQPAPAIPVPPPSSGPSGR